MDDSQPVAGRLRRPSWSDPRLLIGLVLIAIAIVAVAAALRAADQTIAYYVAKEPIAPGTVLERDHLAVERVSVPDGPYVEATASEPWGDVVTRLVDAGELLPASALVDPGDFSGRPVAVSTTLPLAASIDRGSVVDVWITERSDDAAARSRMVAGGLVVADVQREDGAFSVNGSETIYVVVPQEQMAQFLDALAADGDISVVGLAGQP